MIFKLLPFQKGVYTDMSRYLPIEKEGERRQNMKMAVSSHEDVSSHLNFQLHSWCKYQKAYNKPLECNILTFQ